MPMRYCLLSIDFYFIKTWVTELSLHHQTGKLGERELTKTGSDSPNKANKHLRETINGQRVTIGKLFEKGNAETSQLEEQISELETCRIEHVFYVIVLSFLT